MKAILQHKQLVLALAGVFISSFSFCLSLPVLALYFKKVTDASAGDIGTALGLIALIGSVGAVRGGRVADKKGHSFAVMWGASVCAVGYLLLVIIDTIYHGFVVASVLGTGKPLLNPSVKAMVSDNCPEALKDRVFKLRYILICLAFATGPVLGVKLSQINDYYAFYGTSLILIVFVVFIYLTKSKTQDTNAIKAPSENSPETKSSWRSNTPFIMYILGGFWVFVVFSQFENVMPLALSVVTDSPKGLFSDLLMVNAISALLFQFLLMKDVTIHNNRMSIFIGVLFYILSFSVFAFSSNHLILLYPATIFFTLGEVFLFPVSEHLLDLSISRNERGVYYGVAELRQLGFFAGPVTGGFLLDYLGYSSLFICIIFMSCLIYLFFDLGMIRSKRVNLIKSGS